MKYVTSPVLTLGRDGMGAEATEEDFENWVAFVTERIGKACGFKVDILIRGKRDAQDDLIAHADPEQRETIHEAKQCLWEQWCAEDVRCLACEVGDDNNCPGRDSAYLCGAVELEEIGPVEFELHLCDLHLEIYRRFKAVLQRELEETN